MSAKKILSFAAIAGLALSATFCNKPVPLASTPLSDSRDVPVLPEEPIDYPASSNDYLAALGRVLFYDKELSANKNISCGSCHQQSHAFSDNLQTSPGTDNVHGTRNTPSIFAKEGRLFWDGRSTSLPDLALRPVRNSVEMNNQNVNYVVERIASLDYYSHLFKYAFPSATTIDSTMLKIAIAEFLKNFNFSDTKFSKSRNGQVTLTESEQAGERLFFGEAQCGNCHHVDGSFNGGSSSGGYGVTNESHNIGLDATTNDQGVGGVTRSKQDDGAFMMPVLLNCEFTSPYMHDGRFKTLDEVVEHYNSKIQNNPSLDPILKMGNQPRRLNLSPSDKSALVDFLKTLSDKSILTDARFSDPFVPRTQ